MELTKIHEITFDTEYSILRASLLSEDEWVMLLSSGQVTRYKVGDASGSALFSVGKDGITYTDGGFDITAPVSIYTMDNIVVVVNDFKLHGKVHHPEKDHFVRLQRRDYGADISQFPIALYKNNVGIPHLIYSVAWNRLHILNLDTLQILTATKSLIQEGAEERHLQIINDNPDYPQHSWPGEYDYFFGKLLMSPDGKRFLSKGWVWGSRDSCNIYEVEDFIRNIRITEQNVGMWEHSNRAICWIDDATVAVAYDPWDESDEGSIKGCPKELHLYNITNEEPEIVNRFAFDALDGVYGELYYSKKLEAIVAFTPEKGLTICNRAGEVIFSDEAFHPDTFYPDSGLFITAKEKTVSVHRLSP